MKKIKRVIPYLIFALVLVTYWFYIQSNLEKFRNLLNFSPVSILVMLILVFCSISIRGLINYFLYNSLGSKINYYNSFGLAAVNTLANLLPLSGGILAKGFYLKKRFNLAYSTFISATLSLFLSYMSVNGLIGLSVLFFLYVFKGNQGNFWLVSGFFVMTIAIIFHWIKIDLHFLPDRFRDISNNVLNGWRFFSNDYKLLLTLISFQAVATTLNAARFFIAFQIFSQDISFAHCLLFSAATILTQLISIAPGGIGIREGIVAGVAYILSIDPGISAVAVGLERLLATLMIFIIGGFFSYLFSKDLIIEGNI